jgi:glycosyltransferase involved in cell wall biosynthesis
VDDFSHDWDDLNKLVKIYACRGSIEVRLIRLEVNSGAGHARNIGFQNSTGRFVSFLDADDAWCAVKIANVTTVFNINPDVDIIFHDYAEMQKNIPIIGSNFLAFDYVGCEYYLRRNIHPPTVSINRVKFYDFSFFEHRRYSEDFATFYYLMSIGKIFVKINKSLAYGYKSAIGEAGLSADVYSMHSGYLDACFWLLSNIKGKATYYLYLIILLEYIKYPMRRFKLLLRRLSKNLAV